MPLPLSKTDFGNFLACAKAFWLGKRKPEAFPKSAPDAHSQLLAQQGYEFEAIAQKALERRLGKGMNVQTTLESPKGPFSRTDNHFVHPDGKMGRLLEASHLDNSKEVLHELTSRAHSHRIGQ